MSKSIKSCMIVLFTILIMTSCNNEGTPKKVAEHFLTALNAKKWDDAKKYSTEAFGKFLDMLKGFSGQDSSKAPLDKFEITGEKIEADGKTATVTFKTDGDPSPKKLDLTKVNGEWKVDIRMPTTPAMDQPMPDDTSKTTPANPADTTHK